MQTSIPAQMKAAAIDRFGGPEVLHTETLPVPKPGAKQVLIRIDAAGIGVWDPYVRSGEFELGPTRFPMVIGNDGAGEVVAVGEGAARFHPGDRVYAYSMKGGFYAEFAAVSEEEVAPIPDGLTPAQAGVLGADGVTALRGLDDQLRLQSGESLMVYGASGGIGHLAVQLAKRMGARVFAVASGRDGVALCRDLGADVVVDGKEEDVAREARAFAPAGLDAALVLATGDGLAPALATLREGGRIAYPNGVEPPPKAPPATTAVAYDGVPGRDAFERLGQLVGAGPFRVEIGRTFALDEAARAHREIGQHHLGKLALQIH
jgi:NADPH:quinone reductase-like Zn-dependent oxidoreductase